MQMKKHAMTIIGKGKSIKGLLAKLDGYFCNANITQPKAHIILLEVHGESHVHAVCRAENNSRQSDIFRGKITFVRSNTPLSGHK